MGANGEYEPFFAEIDPRTELADSLRDFFVLAITQQKVVDSEEKRLKPAGSLYKTDSKFLKILLEAPAADKVFSGSSTPGTEISKDYRPSIWLLIPLGSYAAEEAEFGIELEDVVLAADEIVVHVVAEEEEPVQFLVRDDYIGPAAPIYTTLEELESYSPPEQEEQLAAAQGWVEQLRHYDIRTIKASNIEAA